ncbi:hypothetical protein [Haloferax sp. ATB1]|uniref:hypothetical protein n=1 Tax=Haloferax sp. ATB1 TaxID=1508454 RepID=UPI001F52210F|nr:hypothetical protein [Haloferax sp. ATB1]
MSPVSMRGDEHLDGHGNGRVRKRRDDRRKRWSRVRLEKRRVRRERRLPVLAAVGTADELDGSIAWRAVAFERFSVGVGVWFGGRESVQRVGRRRDVERVGDEFATP